MAGSVLFDLAKDGETAWWLILLSIFAAFFATFDMVVGFSKQAGIHTNLKDRFASLESKMISGDTEKETWTNYQKTRLNIELDEPPIYIALDALCRNELLIAEGFTGNDYKKQFVKVGTFERLTSNIFKWPNLFASQEIS